jgi:DNA-binding response OmpR family regulator
MGFSRTDKASWLVVEDDFSIRGLLALLIEMWGYHPLTFSDGFEVMIWLDKVEQGVEWVILPKLALLDIRIPGPQGYDIAQRLRKLTRTARVPIVMMTAFRFDSSERQMINELAQPSLFITKPLPDPDELKQMLEAVLTRNELQQNSEAIKKKAQTSDGSLSTTQYL